MRLRNASQPTAPTRMDRQPVNDIPLGEINKVKIDSAAAGEFVEDLG
jgi:hypothetical protein